jgi:membrane fusion protein, heavy metal efflux system
VFDVKAKDADDLLIGKLMLGRSAPTAASSDSLPWYGRVWSYARVGADHLILIVLILLAGLTVGYGLRRRRFRELLVLALVVMALAAAVMDRAASAHEGDRDFESKAAATGDTAKRLPNGQVFVPKPTQRILDIRTAIAKSETHPTAAVFVGRIITNPNRSGLVQSITGGRVIAPEQGLPRLGQAIAKDDLLAFIEPPMPNADRTTISERTGELEH